MIVRTTFVITLITLLSLATAQAKTLMTANSGETSYHVEQVTDGLGVIWAMTFLSKNHLIFTQRSGEVGLFDIRANRTKMLSGAPDVFSSGQGGMLDVAVPPNYQPDDWIYFTYSKSPEFSIDKAATTLARARLNRDKHKLTHWQDLLVTQSQSDSLQHFGSRIAFDGAGHVFFSIGDRGERSNGQNLKTHAGSILRLTLKGNIPKDNPFVNNKKILPEIWSYGHRNPQGMAYDAINKTLWSIEHGPRGGDEINIIQRAKNYGWPVISYGKEYWGPISVGEGTSKPGMEQPVKVYTPSIAPSSLLLYTGKAFPEWRGNLFAGALKIRHLNRVILNNKDSTQKNNKGDKKKNIAEERLLSKLNERIRSLAQSPQGWIYIGTDSGKIIRIVPVK